MSDSVIKWIKKMSEIQSRIKHGNDAYEEARKKVFHDGWESNPFNTVPTHVTELFKYRMTHNVKLNVMALNGELRIKE